MLPKYSIRMATTARLHMTHLKKMKAIISSLSAILLDSFRGRRSTIWLRNSSTSLPSRQQKQAPPIVCWCFGGPLGPVVRMFFSSPGNVGWCLSCSFIYQLSVTTHCLRHAFTRYLPRLCPLPTPDEPTLSRHPLQYCGLSLASTPARRQTDGTTPSRTVCL